MIHNTPQYSTILFEGEIGNYEIVFTVERREKDFRLFLTVDVLCPHCAHNL